MVMRKFSQFCYTSKIPASANSFTGMETLKPIFSDVGVDTQTYMHRRERKSGTFSMMLVLQQVKKEKEKEKVF